MAKLSTEYVFDEATSDAGMTKNQTVFFHLFNPNGLVNQLPEFEDFSHNNIFFIGCEMLYGQHSNYYAKWLRKVAHKPHRYTRSQLAYNIRQLERDIDQAWDAIKQKRAAH